MIRGNIRAYLLVKFRVELHAAASDSADDKAQRFKNIHRKLNVSGDFCTAKDFQIETWLEHGHSMCSLIQHQ